MTKAAATNSGQVSRRSFVATTSLAVAGAMVVPKVAMGAREAHPRLADLGLRDFRALKHERFRTTGQGRAVFELVVVEDFSRAGDAGECFGLQFRQLSGRRLHQGTYAFRNHTVGSLRLFIVPGSDRRGTASYTAIVNRQG